MAKFKQTTKTLITSVDESTGELIHQIDTKSHTYVRKVKDFNQFAMVYLEDMSHILRLDNITQIKLLALI